MLPSSLGLKNIPALGPWLEKLFIGFAEHFEAHFYVISSAISSFLDLIVSILMQGNPWGLLLGAAALTGLIHKNWKTPVITAVGIYGILALGFWQETLETLALITCATLVSMMVGIPLGIIAAHRPWFYRVLRPLLDLMQTIPTFVYLIPTLMLFGLGQAPGLIATIVFAIPAPIRLTHLGITSVPRSLYEVGEAFGASSWQRLLKIELPHARPAIVAGISQSIMLSLSMVVISALVGADGLGKPVVQALNTVNIAKGFEAGLTIVILAMLLDRIISSSPNAASAKGGP